MSGEFRTLNAQSESSIGKSIAEGVQHILSQRIKPAVADKDPFFVIGIIFVPEFCGERVIRILLGPGCRQPAGGCLSAGQHRCGGIPTAAAALPHKNDCAGQVFHRGQFHYAAHIQKQGEFLILTCQ